MFRITIFNFETGRALSVRREHLDEIYPCLWNSLGEFNFEFLGERGPLWTPCYNALQFHVMFSDWGPGSLVRAVSDCRAITATVRWQVI